mmetsp:Transcript_15455/g.27120  ORF Transcript_15455/g.27120 Transcript_15455/m.27120 type:complete len:374 (-) Transcript_15455:42-1163(-)
MTIHPLLLLTILMTLLSFSCLYWLTIYRDQHRELIQLALPWPLSDQYWVSKWLALGEDYSPAEGFRMFWENSQYYAYLEKTWSEAKLANTKRGDNVIVDQGTNQEGEETRETTSKESGIFNTKRFRRRRSLSEKNAQKTNAPTSSSSSSSSSPSSAYRYQYRKSRGHGRTQTPRTKSAFASSRDYFAQNLVGFIILLIAYIIIPTIGIVLARQVHHVNQAHGRNRDGEQNNGFVYNPLGNYPILFGSMYLTTQAVETALEKHSTRVNDWHSYQKLKRKPLSSSSSPEIDDSNQEQDEDLCIICFEPLSSVFTVSSKEKEKDTEDACLRSLHCCQHVFHKNCIDSWAIRTRHNSCPLCSLKIVPNRDRFMKASS